MGKAALLEGSYDACSRRWSWKVAAEESAIIRTASRFCISQQQPSEPDQCADNIDADTEAPELARMKGVI